MRTTGRLAPDDDTSRASSIPCAVNPGDRVNLMAITIGDSDGDACGTASVPPLVDVATGAGMNQFEITILAQLSAHRELLVTMFVYRFLQESDPLLSAQMVKDMFRDSPTTAPRDGTSLDPATSDLLAAMTDEAIEDVMERVIERLDFYLQEDAETAGLERFQSETSIAG
jgi:hypothetical protein